jgi:AcrR family transcriptional regulator
VATAKAPVRRPRRPGRPTENDGLLREHLLDAALARFAKDGIRAAALKDLARDAGATPALVHYYFGNKEQLVAAVIEERLVPVLYELKTTLAGIEGDTRALVRSFVHGLHAVVARHPWLPVIWVREILTEGGVLRELMIGRVAPMIPQVLAKRFAQAQARKDLNPDLDPRLLVVSLIGLTLFPLAAEPIWRRVFNAHDISTEALQSHTLALLERGLEFDHAH